MAAESAAQLFVRLGGKQALDGLDTQLFADIPEGIKPGHVLEFSGQEGSGKSEMLLHLIANCILPKSWKDLNLNGRSVDVIFVDTDYHFQLLRLVAVLEHRILNAIKETPKESQAACVTTISNATNCCDNNNAEHHLCYPDKYNDYEDFIQKCLSHLFIVRCNNSIQLLATVLSLENLLVAKPEVGVFIIDSFSAFYWVDRFSGRESLSNQEANQRKIVDVLARFTQQYHVVLIATKQSLFGSSEKTPRREYLCQTWQRLVNFRYEFSRESIRNGEDFVYSVCHTYPPTNKKLRFYIKENGIQFIN
ncbi:DNA repair protein XRCC2-like [Montipora foliosa]|uniref:DNA repair protein XRCC2-like n=1 Tax=Montipora foliosa TaxID=591990 RepID=UPI0035F14774